MIRVEMIGSPIVSVDGSNYSLTVQCSAYDADNTVVASEALVITGLTTENAETVKAKMSKVMEAWRLKVVAIEEFKAKLGEV